MDCNLCGNGWMDWIFRVCKDRDKTGVCCYRDSNGYFCN